MAGVFRLWWAVCLSFLTVKPLLGLNKSEWQTLWCSDGLFVRPVNFIVVEDQ